MNLNPYFSLSTFIFAAILIVSCTSEETSESSASKWDAVQDPADRVHTVSGFSGPEAVRYDPDQDVYFVSNFGESAEDSRDANGFISRVSAADGSLESL